MWPWSMEERRECDDDDDDDDGKSSWVQVIGWSSARSSWISGVMRDSIHMEFGCCVVVGKTMSELIEIFLETLAVVGAMGGWIDCFQCAAFSNCVSSSLMEISFF